VSAQSIGLLRRGVIAAERGQVRDGIDLIRQSIALDASDPEAHAQLGRWLSRLHRGAEAIDSVERALALEPVAALTLDTIGVVLSRANLHERAVECFKRAAAADPGRASLHFNLGSSLKFTGGFDEAERAYERCLVADPRYFRAHAALSQLRPQTSTRNHVPRLAALLADSALDADAELLLRHALAKELEDLGRHADSFAQLTMGKTRKRSSLAYDFGRDRVLFETVMRLFPEPLAVPMTPTGVVPPRRWGAQAGQVVPIFVVGMPRTGTTLVERILSSHPQVASAGESQNFGVLVKRAAATPSVRVLDGLTLERSVEIDLQSVGEAYVSQTRPDTERPFFVDKMPLNFFYLGHIARALPSARVVVVRRNPLDTCLSNFRQLFAQGFSYYDYAYDLVDTGRYYVMFDRLMALWRRALPGRVHELSYEALVRDQRGETERLLVHCGLPWEEACMGFEQNPAPVATASAAQVREPLHAGAVGRWKNYQRELAPLIAELRAAGILPVDK
jgi:Tfp pilus assembly protein PilF